MLWPDKSISILYSQELEEVCFYRDNTQTTKKEETIKMG